MSRLQYVDGGTYAYRNNDQLEADIKYAEEYLKSRRGDSVIDPPHSSFHNHSFPDGSVKSTRTMDSNVVYSGKLDIDKRNAIIDKLLGERKHQIRILGDNSPTSIHIEQPVMDSKFYVDTSSDRDALIARLLDERRKRLEGRDVDVIEDTIDDRGPNVPLPDIKPQKFEPPVRESINRVSQMENSECSGGLGVDSRFALKEYCTNVKNQNKNRQENIVCSSTPKKTIAKKRLGNQVVNGEKKAREVTRPAEFQISVPKSRHSKQAIAAEENQKLKDALTFKPVLNNEYRPLREDTVGLTGESRLHRLNADAERRELALKSERDRKLAEEMATCTFMPRINRSSVDEDRQLPKSCATAAERLFHEADNRIIIREKAKRQLEEQEMSKYTFSPHILSSCNEESYIPLPDRIKDIQRDRKKKIAQMRVAAETGNKDLTFKPQTNQSSANLAKNRQLEVARLSGKATVIDVVERLQLEGQLIQRRRQKIIANINKEESQECTFQPSFQSAVPDSFLENSKKYGGLSRTEFLKRQDELKVIALRDRAEAEAARVEGDGCTFKPDTGNSNIILKNSSSRHRRHFGETIDERLERISIKDAKRRSEEQHMLEEEHYKKFDFRPRINSISKAIGQSSSNLELMRNDRGKILKEKAEELRKKEIESECTFRPDIRMTNHILECDRTRLEPLNATDVSVRIDNMRREKEAFLADARREIEYERLKECTFQPNLSENRSLPTDGPVIVRGLGRFLELRNLAKKQDEDKKARETSTFMTDASKIQLPTAGYTVPVPFKLGVYDESTKRRKEERLQSVAREHERYVTGECTFRPQTKESSTRELINRILAEDESLS